MGEAGSSCRRAKSTNRCDILHDFSHILTYVLGTKMHQSTRKSISDRKPALLSAIKKFNRYCETLAELYNPEWTIPLPQPLPLQLGKLRRSPVLLEDVWIDPCTGIVPRWLEEKDVREGIRAVLKLDRCIEEQRRLGWEADNLCHWYGRELSSVEVAIALPESKPTHTHKFHVQ